MYFDSQFWPAWVCTHRRSKPTRRGDLKDCLCAWSLVCFDFKARASGAVDARGIKAKQDERVCILIHNGPFVCFGLLGCARTGDQSQPGGGPCRTLFAHGRSSASISRRVHRQLVCVLLVLQTTFQGACSLCCIDVPYFEHFGLYHIFRDASTIGCSGSWI